MKYKFRRVIIALILTGGVAWWLIANPESYNTEYILAGSGESSSDELDAIAVTEPDENSPLATEVLEKIEVKGRAPKTGYTREEFYSSWPTIDGCNLRQRIIKREFGDSAVLADDNCSVMSGEYDEPYTGSHLVFYQKTEISDGVQIDHVVALSDAWQKGAQNLTKEKRKELATDPLNLLAVDSATNQGKSDGDASTWLPPNKAFRCQYVARQVSVKYKYDLWVTDSEKTAIKKILEKCPNEPAIGVEL